VQKLLDISNKPFATIISPHAHSCWEIIYITQGEGITYIGSRPYKFKTGDIICQPPRVNHYRVSEAGYRMICLVLGQVDDFALEIPIYHDNYSKDYLQILKQMMNCYQVKEYNWENIINAHLHLLKEYMISWARTKKSTYVAMCENEIIDNLSSPDFSLSALIDSIPVSNTYFMKQFKKETGYTPNQYLTAKRVEYARSILIDLAVNGLRIKDVAQMTGFNSQCYFSRVFKKVTGLTPESVANVNHDMSQQF